MKRWLVLIILLPLLLLGTTLLYLYRSSSPKPLRHAQFAIVLGNKVYTNGTPSDRLKARLDKAYAIYDKGYVSVIIVSGGIDPQGTNEADAMKNYLRQKGARLSHIIVDTLGNNTHLTAQNTAKAISLKEKIIVVSERFHTPRCELAFRNAGFTDVQTASPDFFEARTIFSWIREVPAYIKYKIKHL